MWPVWIQIAFYCVFFFYLFVLRGRQAVLSPTAQRRQNRIAVSACAVGLALSVVGWCFLLTPRKPASPKVATPVTTVPVRAL